MEFGKQCWVNICSGPLGNKFVGFWTWMFMIPDPSLNCQCEGQTLQLHCSKFTWMAVAMDTRCRFVVGHKVLLSLYGGNMIPLPATSLPLLSRPGTVYTSQVTQSSSAGWDEIGYSPPGNRHHFSLSPWMKNGFWMTTVKQIEDRHGKGQ